MDELGITDDFDSFIWTCRAMAPGVLDSEILGLQTLEHVMRVSRTWDSTVSLLPKGGETIWGNLDWSPEEGHACHLGKKGNFRPSPIENNANHSDRKSSFQIKEKVKCGRMISFGKVESQLPSSQIPSLDPKVVYFPLPLFFTWPINRNKMKCFNTEHV